MVHTAAYAVPESNHSTNGAAINIFLNDSIFIFDLN